MKLVASPNIRHYDGLVRQERDRGSVHTFFNKEAIENETRSSDKAKHGGNITRMNDKRTYSERVDWDLGNITCLQMLVTSRVPR